MTMDLYDIFEESTPEEQEQPELTPVDKDEYAARKKQEREEVYALLDSATEQVKGRPEQFQALLDVQARFDRYSINNALLILAQKPEANRLADFDTWKSENVRINKDEKAISILEPGGEYQRKDGTMATSFNVKKVFDVSQTNKQEKLTPTITRDERLLLKALITNAPCKMVISEEMAVTLNAIYKPENRTIYIRPGMDGPTIFRSLANELAHAHMDKGEGYSRAHSSATAYCVAYVLCKRYGVPTDSFRFDSVPAEFSKLEAKEFRAEMSKVRSVAGEISMSMNKVLEVEQTRDKKDRGDAR